MPLSGMAQDDFEAFKKKADSEFSNYKKKAKDEFEEFRRKANEEYADMVKKAWKEYRSLAGIPDPEDKVKPVPPKVYPKQDEKKPEPKPEPKPLPYDEVVTVPAPKPQPQPVVPIKEKPEPVKPQPVTPVTPPVKPKATFTYFGTEGQVRFNASNMVELSGVDEKSIAKAWKAMSTSTFDNLVFDCLQIRKEKNLCDWAYLEMLRAMAEHFCGKGTNKATLLMAYVYCQSGYKMRLARDGQNKLFMLYGSEHVVYNQSYYTIEGLMYYPYNGAPKSLYVCNVAFPKESTMSLYVPSEQQFAMKATDSKTRQSKRYPEVKTTMVSNKNLMDFYTTYPTSKLGENLVSRWAMYANTPLSQSVKDQIYPSLRQALNGCDELTAVNKLLNYVQTGFVYEYDDKVWGHDRAFFAEESLFYPYCDCEDRSILFTRLVRDLVGLDCILIYYPGHLASAVLFNKADVTGDYILLNGKKFIVSDATYINAPVGRTMPGMDNRAAKVIILER